MNSDVNKTLGALLLATGLLVLILIGTLYAIAVSPDEDEEAGFLKYSKHTIRLLGTDEVYYTEDLGVVGSSAIQFKDARTDKLVTLPLGAISITTRR